MNWNNWVLVWLWLVIGKVLNRFIDASVNIADNLANLASVAGGALVATSSMLRQYNTINVSYYGGADIHNATVDFNVTVPKLAYSFTETVEIPDESVSRSGVVTIDIGHYVTPATLEMVGYIAFCSGLLLKVSAANVSYWKEGREDLQHAQSLGIQQVSPPSTTEYSLVTFHSISQSLFLSALAYQATLVVTYYITGQLARQMISYPSDSRYWEQSGHYDGPVKRQMHNINYQIKVNETVEVPYFKIPVKVLIKSILDAQTTLREGGYLLWQQKKIDTHGLVFATGITATTLLANSIFSTALCRERRERILGHNGSRDEENPMPALQNRSRYESI